MNKKTLIEAIFSLLSLLVMTVTPSSAFAETPQSTGTSERKQSCPSYEGAQTSTESDQDFYDFIDMKVEIRNVEDVTQLAVEQWDEYEEVPYIYEVENFREGYFMANLDPECSTTLSLLSVIGRHLCRSNAIFLPASLNQEQDVTFNIEQEQIAISGLSDEEARNRLISFSIASYPSSTVIAEGIVNYNSYVDISQLSPGNYILSIRKEGRILGRTKFTK